MKKIITFVFLLSSFSIFSQINQSGDVVEEINTIISSLPSAGGLEYSAPTLSQVSDWENLLVDLFSANYNNANTKAIALGYDLIAFTDTSTGTLHYLLKTTFGGVNYWGTYVFNPSACRSELVMMSPHSKKDLNTGKEGIYCYKTVDAFFFMLNGTNRCNQIINSTCSGTTTVCNGGNNGNYKISDMAHVVNSIWQTTTQYLNDNFSYVYFVQLHGFTKKITDPYLIISNGTKLTPFPDKIVSLKNNLILEDNTLSFKIAHIDLSWNRLIGFTNTNGRYINNGFDPCQDVATTTSGRFLHVEQEKTKLRQDSTGWHKMATALANTFNANSCPSISPISSVFYKNKKDLRSFVFFDGQKINVEYPFPKQGQFILFNQLGQVILNTSIQKGANEIPSPSSISDIYFFQIKTKQEVEVGKIFLY